MYYETTAKVTIVNNNGKEKVTKEHFLIENITTFSEAELATIFHYQQLNIKDFEVCAIKQSKVYETIGKVHNRKYFRAIVSTMFVDRENDKEQELKYTFLIGANTYEEAYTLIKEHLKQGYDDFTLTEIKSSKILDILSLSLTSLEPKTPVETEIDS